MRNERLDLTLRIKTLDLPANRSCGAFVAAWVIEPGAHFLECRSCMQANHHPFKASLQRPESESRRVPPHIIVHRDGRFLAGEAEELERALSFVPKLSLVSVKKDSRTRLEGHKLGGATLRLSPARSVLVTNAQAVGRLMPAPLEIEVNRADGMSLADSVSQVYWLSQVFHGSLYHSKRLPVTTEVADRMASTGNRNHKPHRASSGLTCG